MQAGSILPHHVTLRIFACVFHIYIQYGMLLPCWTLFLTLLKPPYLPKIKTETNVKIRKKNKWFGKTLEVLKSSSVCEYVIKLLKKRLFFHYSDLYRKIKIKERKREENRRVSKTYIMTDVYYFLSAPNPKINKNVHS